MIYNTTVLENTTSILGIVRGVNDLTNQVYGFMFVLFLGVVLTFVVMQKTGRVMSSIVSGSFVTTIISILLYTLDLVSVKAVIGFFILLITSVVLLMVSE
jgi:hypothetical protein